MLDIAGNRAPERMDAGPAARVAAKPIRLILVEDDVEQMRIFLLRKHHDRVIDVRQVIKAQMQGDHLDWLDRLPPEHRPHESQRDR